MGAIKRIILRTQLCLLGQRNWGRGRGNGGHLPPYRLPPRVAPSATQIDAGIYIWSFASHVSESRIKFSLSPKLTKTVWNFAGIKVASANLYSTVSHYEDQSKLN